MPSKIILDSSVILKWFYKEDEKHLAQAELTLKHILEGKTILLVPELVKYEVLNVLLTSKKLPYLHAKDALDLFFKLPISFAVLDLQLASNTYKIALEAGITYYDASFVALARQENAVLVTDNPKHQAKIKEVKVVPLKDYK